MRRIKILQISLVLLGLIFIAAGVIMGEAREIFEKATIICMECIGLGG
ncbi:MAG: hypothetical protein FWB80_09680 [Defluviitaleaceae bacterium]|nr:hypothetical protein [Defluviitaleaceae bacterium]